MKTPHSSATVFTLAAFMLGSTTLLPAQPLKNNKSSPDDRNRPVWEQGDQPPSNYDPRATQGRVQRMNRSAEMFGLNRMVGRPVRSVKGEQLSTIMDFLVDPQSGRVHFAILPAGGGPKGMTYRIVPISAFTGATEDAMVLRLDHAQWDRVGTMEEWQLKDRVTIDLDHQQRLSRQLGLPLKEIYDGSGPADLVRASTLRGQAIRSGTGQIGRIDDVVVDVTRHEFAAVFTSDPAFAGSEQHYVVPFQHLGTRESGGWASRLNRDDFPPSEGAYQPTGHSAAFDPDGSRGARDDYDRSQPVEPTSALAAVKQNLDRSPARGRVEATWEGRRLILRGLVDNDQERSELERMAMQTAPGVRIDNQIAVRHH